ncbi:hypothetical protein C8J56DRAFT_385429 [Mycena floridula]|nr:hypothetical protein C8J56DRAFT_385429 [Mycena floridula]
MLPLATELVLLILDMFDPQLDRKTLYSLLFVSPYFRSEVERILYQRISSASLDELALVQFLTTVITKPSLGKLVISFSLDSIPKPSPGIKLDWQRLPLALQTFSNLKSLRFGCSLINLPAALQICTFQLHHFHWRLVISTEIAHEIHVFIQKQQSLKSLHLVWCDQPMDSIAPRVPEMPLAARLLRRLHILPEPTAALVADPWALPQTLHVLHGNYSALKTFLPHIRVTSLIWEPDLEDSPTQTEIDSPEFSQSLQYVTDFTFGGYFGGPPFSWIARYLSNVTRLHLIRLDRDREHYLYLITTLEHLTLSSSIDCPLLTIRPLDQRLEFTSNLFERLPLLNDIHISLERSGISYQRWQRGLETPTIMKENIFIPYYKAWPRYG